MMNARLEELRSKFQENPRRYFAPFANELRKGGDPAQAIAVCRAQLATQPGHVSGHIVLGQALYEAGEAHEARDVFTTALDLDPENLIALRSLGELAQVDGEFGMARQWYERLLDADPRNAEVSQLLKDLPTEKPSRPPVTPDVAAVEAALPEALPDGANSEFAPKPASTIHTGFTGSGPAYKSETDEEPTREEARAERTDFAPPSHVESVDPDQHIEPPLPAAAEAEAETLDMIDTHAFSSSAPVTETQAEPSLPDESFERPNVPVAHDKSFEAYHGPASMNAADVEEIRENAPVNEAEVDVPEDTTPETPTAETPRARFAEHGFEGPADDQIGWMTTPSAALSDLESAPENWFDEPAAAETDQPSPEARDQETAAVEVSDDRADQWFDEVEGASAIESVEVSSEEFWLPPELPQIHSAEEVTSPAPDHDHEDAPVSAETAAVFALADDTADDDAAVTASAKPDAAHFEAESVGVAAMAEEIDDAIVTEPRAEIAAGRADQDEPEPDQSTEPREPEPAQSEQWTQPVESAPAQAPQWGEPLEAEPAATAEWAPPYQPEPVEATHAFDYQHIESAAEGDDFANTAPSEGEPTLAENVIGHTPGFIDSVSPTPAPFVTETLAELYLQQGFRDEALAIYRQLVERDPGSEPLRLRIQEIEKGTGSEVAPPDVPIEARASSQSVRSFFSRLARRPAVTGPAASTTPSGTSQPDQEIPFAVAASALANLFSASKPPATDEGAAATLAGAFTDPAGRPSRAADGELSLDHLFREFPPGGSASTGVSLDEFYATPSAPPGSPTEPGEDAGSAEPGGTDIRQFTAWLEGLRKK